MSSFLTDEKFSLLDIIIIACFISLVFSPVGVVLMWWKSKWSKKSKLIVTGVFALIIAAIITVVVLMNVTPKAGNGSGNPLVGIERKAEGGGGGSRAGSSQMSKPEGSPFVQKVTKSRWFYFFILVVVMAIIAVIRNLKGFKPKGGDANPYVDTNLYEIPIPDGFVFPEVKFSKLPLQADEKIYFATPAELKDNSGDIVITNKRFMFLGRKENYDFPLKDLTSIFSLSNTTLSLSAGEKTYYFFIHHSQMRFVLQITKYVYGSAGDNK